MEMENDILGFNPAQLSVLNPVESTGSNGGGNPLIYKPKPSESKSDDGVYRSQIKIIYNAHDIKNSVLEQQAYAIQDENGFLTVVSSLTANDKNCPIFKAWKQCHFSTDPTLQKQALSKDKGGNALFDKRFARYVTIQIIEDNNHPELEGRYMFWKMPKFIWDAVNAKMNPTSDRKAQIPVMDFLFGRAIDLEVTPGPDDPKQPERKTREISYNTSEITDDVVSCTAPDGSPLLTDEQQAVLDAYVDVMSSKVWKEKDPDKRNAAITEIKNSDNYVKLQAIYREVLEQIKQFCPNIIDELGYKPWTPEVTERVNKWIKTVLAGNDPTVPTTPAGVIAAVESTTVAAPVTTPVSTPAADTVGGDDLPF